MGKVRSVLIRGTNASDPSTMEEPEPDNEFTRQMWLEEMINDEEFNEDVQSDIEKYKSAVRVTANPDKLHIHMSGHSHIDIAWKWRYEQTRQKGLLTLKKALIHGQLFPGQFTYSNSEPILLEWIMQDAPEVFEDIKNAVNDGTIELVGGAFVEPDCMMPCGEAFVRQRLYGQKFYQDHFNRIANVEWFLDSFGYNVGLPQLILKCGGTSFWTNKITWNRITVFPFVNFWWESPDGSQLLTANFHMGYGTFDNWIKYEIGRHPIKEGGKRKWDYRDNYEDICDEIDDDPDNIIPPIGCFFGAGDGGHGPMHREVAFAQIAAKNGFGKWSRAETFFDELREYGDKLPIWNDELYLEYHQGTFSVHFEVKRNNQYFERKLIGIEQLFSLLSVSDGSYVYPQDRLETLWKVVCLNHFHNVLPGSSIPEVYDDVCELWKEMNEGIDEIFNEWNATSAVPEGTQITISNPVAWDRTSPAFIPLALFEYAGELDADGKPPYVKLTRIDKDEVLIGQPVAAERGDKDDTKNRWMVGPRIITFLRNLMLSH